MKQPFSCVVFDLDGTLLDTLEDIAEATNRALAAHGLPTHPVDAYRYMVGDGVATLIERAVPQEHREARTMERIARAYRAEYARTWNNKSRPYPGIATMLDELVVRGIRMAVLSNKPHEFTVQCVAAYLSKWKFDAVMGQREGVPRKPDPAAALEIARQLARPAGQFIYVGDTATDMQTAKAAGMFAVGVLWGFRGREELEDNGAQSIIARPEELMALLSGHSPG